MLPPPGGISGLEIIGLVAQAIVTAAAPTTRVLPSATPLGFSITVLSRLVRYPALPEAGKSAVSAIYRQHQATRMSAWYAPGNIPYRTLFW